MCDCLPDMDRLDFELDDTRWKEVFSTPGGLIGGRGCLSPKAFAGTRAAIFLVWFACCIWSNLHWVTQYEYKYYWTQLTHWSAAVELLYFGFAACTSYLAIFSSVPDGLGASTPWFVSVTWLLSAIVPVLSFMVCVLFWALVFEPGPGKPPAIDVVMHGGNLALALVDLLLNRQPYYIDHVYAPFTFSGIYCLFTVVYYLAGGKNKDGVQNYIYDSVDWSKPRETASLLGVIVILGVPIVYAGFFLVVACRVRARKAAAACSGVPVAANMNLLRP
mmetsp:Transcript_49569/g.126302  ORF Transcript_49569/g.126302 Transcript_49569/m.126302 type:complete len:275 (-) Transcript_49569:213-1037(-)